MQNRVTALFSISYPIIQAGMIWCSGWQLASAVSNAGGLGIIGSGSMYPDVLKEHIIKCQAATKFPFGVNVPLLYPDVKEHFRNIVDLGVKIVFTSAGNPMEWTPFLKSHGIKVVHVIASRKFALKAESAGADAVVAEGFEAGGHNGREETTTMCLLPMICDTVKIPVIAAGGIADGRSMMAAFSLGAEGVQLGSRFVATPESSAHEKFKNNVINSNEGDTVLTLKQLTPVRMMKNRFYNEIENAYAQNASVEELKALLGKGRAKKGMFEGKLDEGELEIGQVSAAIKEIKPAAEVVKDVWNEFIYMKNKISGMQL